jgi:phage replication O-like protein O
MEKLEEMENFNKGFTQIPHKVGNLMPLLNLTSRQWRVVHLIIRLTYGCNKRWAKLKQADLWVCSISAEHAKEVLEPLVRSKIIEKNGNKKEYRLNEEYLDSELTKQVSFNLEDLRNLVKEQLIGKHYQTRSKKLPKIVTNKFLPKEEGSSQSGQEINLPKTELLDSESTDFDIQKDRLNKKKYNDRKNSSTSKKLELSPDTNPDFFNPATEAQYEMFQAFLILDGGNPNSFRFYIQTLNNGLPASKFRDFKNEILRTPKVKNKGALFVKMVKQYLGGVIS